jgi:hypothetical protein
LNDAAKGSFEDRRKGGGDHHVNVGALPSALEDDTKIE